MNESVPDTSTERKASIERETRETRIRLALNLDAPDPSPTDSSPADSSPADRIRTGIPFYDHMLDALAKHARFALELECDGDLAVDDHHTVEDCALALGSALDQALGGRRGIERFAHAYAPLDEALARVVVDLSGRPFSSVDLGLKRETLGGLSCENIPHFFQSFASQARASIHVDVLRGDNDHHRAEAAFKALALALRRAVRRTGDTQVPSTKGVL